MDVGAQMGAFYSFLYFGLGPGVEGAAEHGAASSQHGYNATRAHRSHGSHYADVATYRTCFPRHGRGSGGAEVEVEVEWFRATARPASPSPLAIRLPAMRPSVGGVPLEPPTRSRRAGRACYPAIRTVVPATTDMFGARTCDGIESVLCSRNYSVESRTSRPSCGHEEP